MSANGEKDRIENGICFCIAGACNAVAGEVRSVLRRSSIDGDSGTEKSSTLIGRSNTLSLWANWCVPSAVLCALNIVR